MTDPPPGPTAVRVAIHDAVKEASVNPEIATNNRSRFTAKDFK